LRFKSQKRIEFNRETSSHGFFMRIFIPSYRKN